jgi:glycosyltransferase involved in cell wall biosynthesis
LYLPNPFPGAAWRRIEFFAEHLKNKEHEVFIAGTFSAKSLDKAGLTRVNEIRILNVIPIIMASNMFSLIFNILSSIFTSVALFIFLRPETVIISVPNGETALGSYIVAKLFRTKKVVIDYRDEWEDHIISRPKSGIYKKSYRYLKNLMTKCYSNSGLVITTTEPLAYNLTSRGVRDVKVVPNGADIDIFKPYCNKYALRSKTGFDGCDLIMVYSGGIGLYYRLDIVLKALKKINDKVQNVKLLMVGYGSNIEKIVNLAVELGLQNNVFYLGAKMEKIELAEILSSSDIGLVPYDSNSLWKNSMPVKALEYLACGLPIIATVYKDSILGKLISENKIGMIADPEDVDSLADVMEKMYENNKRNSSFLKDAGNRGILLVKERFNRNTIAEQLFSLLKIPIK